MIKPDIQNNTIQVPKKYIVIAVLVTVGAIAVYVYVQNSSTSENQPISDEESYEIFQENVETAQQSYEEAQRLEEEKKRLFQVPEGLSPGSPEAVAAEFYEAVYNRKYYEGNPKNLVCEERQRIVIGLPAIAADTSGLKFEVLDQGSQSAVVKISGSLVHSGAGGSEEISRKVDFLKENGDWKWCNAL